MFRWFIHIPISFLLLPDSILVFLVFQLGFLLVLSRFLDCEVVCYCVVKGVFKQARVVDKWNGEIGSQSRHLVKMHFRLTNNLPHKHMMHVVYDVA